MLENNLKRNKLPWEFRLNTFTPITIDGYNKINYFYLQNNILKVGFHGEKETSGEQEVGEIMETHDGGKLLLIDDKTYPYMRKVLSFIQTKMSNTGIEILMKSEMKDYNA